MDINQYLNRINIQQTIPPSIASLKQLQKNHVEAVAWENLDLFFLKKVSFEHDYIFDKIVNNKQGGICFELNYIYHQLLTQLGFQAKLIPTRIFSLNDKKYNTPRETHVVILVEIEGRRYLTDVGWNGFRNPMPLTGEIMHDISGAHRIYQDEQNNTFLQKMFGNDWCTQYQFFDKKIETADITKHLDYRGASPEREVAHHLIYVQHTPLGLISLWDENLVIQENKIKKEYHVSAMGGLREIFTRIFKLSSIEKYEAFLL